jgi:hypothetical protein
MKMICQNYLFSLWLISFLLIGSANCMSFLRDKKVRFGETFTLKRNETAMSKDGKLKVKLNGVGRTISESGEFVYVQLQVNLNTTKRKITFSKTGKKGAVTVGDYIIQLVSAESFGETYCKLKILRKI